MATVGDLFAELETSCGSSISEPTKIIESKPDQVAKFDSYNENLILQNTGALRTSLAFCEEIVIAAYNIADYVPLLSNDEDSKFWTQNVIPNLVETLKQDVAARAVMIRAFAAIRDLGFTIQNAAEVIQQTGGSENAIKIAQDKIPAALKKIEDFIEMADKMDNYAINTFAAQTDKIFRLIGPKAANFVQEKEEIECQLNKLYEKQQKLYSTLGEKRGAVTRYDLLISATKKYLNGVAEDVDEIKRRNDELNQLNGEIDKKIQNIPSAHWRIASRGIFFWRLKFEKVENTNRDKDRQYYESMIIARKARISGNQNEADAKRDVMNDLNKSLSEYESEHAKALLELENYGKTFAKETKDVQESLNKLYEKKNSIDKQQTEVEQTVGLYGKTLLECLIAVRVFARTLKGGATAYTPLVSILNGIKAIVEVDVALLQGKREEIFLAGTRLLRIVGFLSRYSTGARSAVEVSNEYRSLPIEND